VRWDRLFDDLEAQLERGLRGEEAGLGAEEERLRLSRLGLRDRLLSLVRSDGESFVELRLASGDDLALRPKTFGRDWVAGDLRTVGPIPAQGVLPLHAVESLAFASEQLARSLASPPPGPRARSMDRIGLGILLRELCRRRVAVTLLTRGARWHGTIDRVGADHLDLALHEPGTPRSARELRGHRTVPFAALLLVRVD